MKKQTILLISLLVISLLVLGGQTAMAATTCIFTTVGATMTLDGDCTADETIFIPDGYTLDGDGYTITAVDPDGGHFLGAVVKNEGTTAHVKNLTIDTDSLTNVCDSGDDRLRGIMFQGASGSIINNNVLNLNQGNSGCQEGNAIEVRNEPFDGTHPNTQTVTVMGNVVTDYQKGGIICNGDVNVTVENNSVTGFGPVDFIAQNGIQFGFGGFGTAANNTIWGNTYTGGYWASGGILVYAGGDGIELLRNQVDTNDVGIWVIDADDALVWGNTVTASTYDGIALDAYYASVSGAYVARNHAESNDVGIGLYGATTTDNLIKRNRAQENVSVGFFVGYGATANVLAHNRAKYNDGHGFWVIADGNSLERNTAKLNDGSGIVVDGEGNTIYKNLAKDNGNLDIENMGDNAYIKNHCDTSSGPPVDCGTTPLAPTTPASMAAATRAAAQPADQ